MKLLPKVKGSILTTNNYIKSNFYNFILTKIKGSIFTNYILISYIHNF